MLYLRYQLKIRGNINTRVKQFFESEAGIALRQELIDMTQSDQYNTRSTYSLHEESGITFVDKHMHYMSRFPDLNCAQYVSNLKLMTKIK